MTHTDTGAGTALDARFATARQVADAVLYEGYVLYPYRASAAKNRMRWQFGVLMPEGWCEDSGEHCVQRTECLLEPRPGAELRICLRFLRAQRRTVQAALPEGGWAQADRLELADRVLVPWDEGVEEQVQLTVPVDALFDGGVELPFTRAAAELTEPVTEDGAVVGRLVRQLGRVDGVLRLTAVELPGPYGLVRLVAETANGYRQDRPVPDGREAALPHALVAVHLLLGLTAGRFLSMTDPPEWARPAAVECRNERGWPVLAGNDGGDDVLLCSPIILEDHPRIAPESPGALYDSLEIDEILALRTATLTEQEKREARGTDDRAAAVIDLADSLPPEIMERLHGAVRGLREVTAPPDSPLETATPWWNPEADSSVDPATDHVLVDGVAVAAGSRVVLKPGLRRTDAQDLFLIGRRATVEAVIQDVDGGVHVAVTLEDDPGTELRRLQGRFWYFQPDELALLEES
ncbi:hypothetical protein [Kitasatospora viridis]|uniref:Uncharacterized protein n=1 Tax=Kitasatospora viridis TaxID=281105 RepID=A0A561SDT1_9ACTN|nr:hypothetical protein [Kitasatospora viridis]TWF73014.1 hypothetical protein FHX73_16165 [Kitasatospora viridis]